MVIVKTSSKQNGTQLLLLCGIGSDEFLVTSGTNWDVVMFVIKIKKLLENIALKYSRTALVCIATILLLAFSLKRC